MMSININFSILNQGQLEFKPRKNELLILWLGGASFYIKDSNNIKILMDPYLSNSVYHQLKPFFRNPEKDLLRLNKPTFSSRDLECDYIITTHDHLDHLDPETIEEYKDSKNTIFVGPSSCCKHFKNIGIEDNRILRVDRNDNFSLINGIELFGVYSRHRGPLDLERSSVENIEIYGPDDSIGILIKFENITIYHTGDTSFENKLFNVGTNKIDILLLASNGIADNMTPDEGALLTKELKPSIVIPQHFGVIPFTNFDPVLLEEAFEKYHVDSRLIILRINEALVYKK